MESKKIEYPKYIEFEIENIMQHKTMLALFDSYQNGSINIDKFLFWAIKNYDVKQSIFLRQFDKQ